VVLYKFQFRFLLNSYSRSVCGRYVDYTSQLGADMESQSSRLWGSQLPLSLLTKRPHITSFRLSPRKLGSVVRRSSQGKAVTQQRRFPDVSWRWSEFEPMRCLLTQSGTRGGDGGKEESRDRHMSC